jgi:hypothetical protein
MSAIFHYPRFMKLWRLHLKQFGSGYLMMLLGFTLLCAVIWGIGNAIVIGNHDRFEEAFQALFGFVLVYIAPLLFGMWYYGRLGKNEGLISFLTVPASHFEKFILSILWCLVLPLCTGILVYHILEFSMMTMHKILAVEPPNYRTYSYNSPFHGEHVLRMMIDEAHTKFMIFAGVCVYLVLNGFLVFSSIFFRKYMVFKTALLATIIITLSLFIVYVILESTDVNESHLVNYAEYIFGTGAESEPGYWNRIEAFVKIIFCALGISGIIFWITTYMQLTEREVK